MCYLDLLGFAAADHERMQEINREVGLEEVERSGSVGEHGSETDEKTGVKHKEGSF